MNSSACLPEISPKSLAMASQISSAMASADLSVSRRRPGSPWMPTPNSISSGPMSKVGLPAAGTVQEVSATPIERVAPLTASPSALSACRSMPASAAAPTIFSTTRVPATPRRPVV